MANKSMGGYKIVLQADYNGLTKAVEAAMKAIVDKTQTATNAVNKMSEQIDTAMGMPAGWYSKAANQRGSFEWWHFYYIAKALKIPCDDLVGTAPGLAN